MQSRNTAPTMEKYRMVPRTRQPVAEGEIRVSMMGRMPLYVSYAGRLFNERQKKSITIKATGNAIPGAITLTEILKRRFENLHQQNSIGVSRTFDTYEPMELGLDQVSYERDVSFIEIILSKDVNLVDVNAAGYQSPVDQALVRPLIESAAPERDLQSSNMSRGRRGGMRGSMRGSIRGNYQQQSQRGMMRGYRGTGMRSRGNLPSGRGIFAGGRGSAIRMPRGGGNSTSRGSYRGSYRGGNYRGGYRGRGGATLLYETKE